MTLDDFIEALKATPRDWMLTGDLGCLIRRGEYADDLCPQCPVGAVGPDHRIPPIRFQEIARRIGLDPTDALRIANAADMRRPFNPALRALLLDATGISERVG